MIVAQEKTGYYRPEEPPPPKKEPRKKVFRKNHRLALIGLVIAGFLVGVAITVFCAQTIALGYQITHLEEELALLRVENNSLDQEIQRLTSLERIEYLAANELGMIKPDVNNVLVVTIDGANQSTRTPGPAGDEGQATGYAPAEKEKNRFLNAFDELLNRLKNTIQPEQRLGFEPAEGKNADNTDFGAQENNLCVYSSCAAFLPAGFTPRLAAAC